MRAAFFRGARVDRVVRRIVTGLLYGETGKPLPSNYATKAYLLTQIDASANDVLAFCVAAVLQAPLSVIGPRTVGYRILHATDVADASACLVTFYERVTWLGLAAPARDLRPPRTP